MAHIHDLIDFTIGVYIVHKNKVLLVDHKALKMWLPIGGHIELDEDPDQAALREAKEESGLDIEIVAEKGEVENQIVKPLFRPEVLNIHSITKTHRHIGLFYFAKAITSEVILEDAHNQIKWFSKRELRDPKFSVPEDVQIYGKKAIEKIGW